MVAQERMYSALVVSSSDKMNAAFRSLLPANRFHPITQVGSVAAAERAVLENGYDLVIVNTPLPDDFGTRFAIDACAGKSVVCLLLVKAEMQSEIRPRALRHGIFTLSKPTSPSMLAQSVEWMIVMRERLRGLEKKAMSLEEKMDEIRIVNRAKWRLIEQFGMSEADAHRLIEKKAMDDCVTRREIALRILNDE